MGKNNEYEELYGLDDEDIIEESEYESMEQAIEELKGTISEGDCYYCGAENAMKYHGNCFICEKCGNSMHENTYYVWQAGYPVETID